MRSWINEILKALWNALMGYFMAGVKMLEASKA
jgi:hypothetical protein